MRICGVEIKGSTARLAVVEEDDDGGPRLVPSETKKITLKDDRSKDSLNSFKGAIESFIHENSIDAVCIKERAKKGSFAGGAISFKIETLIQLVESCDVNFISSQRLAMFAKTNYAGAPAETPAYLATAFSCGAYLLGKNK